MLDEPGSELVDVLWNDAAGSTSVLVTYPEARAALARARRERRLSPYRHARARAELDDRWDEVDGVAIDDQLAREAGRLADELTLRALDAIQLAGALAVAEDDLVVATWDARLSAAARASGLHVAP